MTHTPSNTTPDYAALLLAWAGGYRPSVAAARFLVDTGQVGRAIACGLVTTGTDEHTGEPFAYIDPHAAMATGPGSWHYAAGAYSSGERAILALAASLVGGLLDDCLWSLDRTNRAAFIAAITTAGGI